jgi:hypothetical protein
MLVLASPARQPNGATRRGLASVAPPPRSGRRRQPPDIGETPPRHSPPFVLRRRAELIGLLQETSSRGRPPLVVALLLRRHRQPKPRLRAAPPAPVSLHRCRSREGANSYSACEGPAPLPMQGSPLHQRVDLGATVVRDAVSDRQRHPR